jgi:formylglycine-generating enzyme required for sulfatase activity
MKTKEKIRKTLLMVWREKITITDGINQILALFQPAKEELLTDEEIWKSIGYINPPTDLKAQSYAYFLSGGKTGIHQSKQLPVNDEYKLIAKAQSQKSRIYWQEKQREAVREILGRMESSIMIEWQKWEDGDDLSGMGCIHRIKADFEALKKEFGVEL